MSDWQPTDQEHHDIRRQVIVAARNKQKYEEQTREWLAVNKATEEAILQQWLRDQQATVASRLQNMHVLVMATPEPEEVEDSQAITAQWINDQLLEGEQAAQIVLWKDALKSNYDAQQDAYDFPDGPCVPEFVHGMATVLLTKDQMVQWKLQASEDSRIREVSGEFWDQLLYRQKQGELGYRSYECHGGMEFDIQLMAVMWQFY